MRHVLAWIIGLVMLIPASATALDQALVLGFHLDSQRELRLTSLSTSPRLPVARPVAGPSWTMTATLHGSDVLWTRSLPAPRQFHAADLSASFAIVVPRPSPGTRLSLRDETRRELWSADIDRPMLDVADTATLKAQPLRTAAITATRALVGHQTEPALQKQIETAQAAQRELRIDARSRPADSHLDSEVTARPQSSEPRRSNSPKLPATASDVVARVVDESGNAVGTAFAAILYEVGGNGQELQVAADGSVRLTLNPGRSYDLSLLPPPPFINATVRFSYSGAPLDDFVVKRGWRLEMVLKDARTRKPLEVNEQDWYSLSSDAFESFVVTASAGRLLAAVPMNSDAKLTLGLLGPPGYAASISYPIGRVSGDQSMEVLLDPAESVTANIVTQPGANFSGNFYAECTSQGTDNQPRYTTSSTAVGLRSIRVSAPLGRTYDCDVTSAEARFTRRFTNVVFGADKPTTWTIPSTVNVRFDAVDTAGRPYRQPVYGSSTDRELRTRSSCSGNPCMLRLPSKRAETIRFDFDEANASSTTVGPEVFADGDRRTVTVRREYRVSGRVVNDQATSYSYPRIRALDASSGRFVLSTRTNWIGEYEDMPLTEGRYVFEVDTNHGDGGRGDAFYRRPQRTSPITISGDQRLPDIVLDEELGEVRVTITRPCSWNLTPRSWNLASAHLTASDGTRIHRALYSVAPESPTADGQCSYEYLLVLSPGEYRLAITPLGWVPHEPLSVQVVANQVARYVDSFAADQYQLVWSPRFSDRHGKPLHDMPLTMYDETQSERFPLTLDEDGRIGIPYARGWGVEIEAPNPGRTMRRTFLFGRDPLPNEVVLDELPLQETMEDGLVRLHGDGNRERRFNILMLADGYVEEQEPFVDGNRNGVWDGTIWYDLDGDHVYSPGDLINYDLNRPEPVFGTVPTSDNEPFDDLNGDGHASVDDKGLFLEGARSFLRSLLGSDFWSEHRDAFNVYLLFTPSPDAGFSITVDGEKVLSRRTRYDATFELPQSILQLDREAALADALALLPEVDLVIVAVNTPLYGPRSNSTLAQPGVMVLAAGPSQISANDTMPSHEMAHFIGSLCDEYEEFGGFTPFLNTRPFCPNVSYSNDPAEVPWLSWLLPGFAPPSRDIDGSMGMFEGADYYPGGAYRPSYESTMRSLTPFFNAPSRAALERAIGQRTQAQAQSTPSHSKRPRPSLLPRRD